MCRQSMPTGGTRREIRKPVRNPAVTIVNGRVCEPGWKKMVLIADCVSCARTLGDWVNKWVVRWRFAMTSARGSGGCQE